MDEYNYGGMPAVPQQRMVGFWEAVKRGFDNYAMFTGRVSRSEFWYWHLFVYVVGVIVGAILVAGGVSQNGQYSVETIIGLAFFLPTLGMSIRRLHDTGRTGWWVWINLIPLIGQIVLLVFYVERSEPIANKYGDIPNVE